MAGGSTGGTLTSIAGMLAGWLPRQRWFPGRGTAVSDLTVVSDVVLAHGEPGQPAHDKPAHDKPAHDKPAHDKPALRHLIVAASLPHGMASFQVLVGSRAKLPPSLSDAVIGELNGIIYYDALHDPELATVLLGGIAEQREADPLRFVKEPAAQIGAWQDSRRLTAEQSNTSLIFGERAILKVLRRLFPGANPDLEVADALARLGSARVAAPYGWIETHLNGEPVLLAVLSEYLAHATDGWDLARAGMRRVLDDSAAAADGRAGNAEQGEDHDFIGQARALGAATAELHGDMAKAFGSRTMTRAELADLADDLHSKLADAIEVVPELRQHSERLAAAFAAVAKLSDPVTVQRIHGDYHLGQVMFGQHGWVALDFEGEPGVPLAKRRAPASPLKDVAGMLRSFDYAARHELAARQHEQRDLTAVAASWARQCQAEFCAGYEQASGADTKPRADAAAADAHAKADGNAAASTADQATLLRALTLEKAVYEVVYEHRHRPSWVHIPLDFLATS